MEKISNFIIPILKCFKIRVKIGTLMAFIFCVILFYVVSKVLGFQSWETFDQVFFVMFYLGFYGLIVHLFNYNVDEKVREINEGKKKEEILNKDKKELFNALNRSGENVRKFFEDLIKANKDIFEINAESKIIIEYLKIRGLNILEINKMGELDIAIIKEKYFTLLQEYFHVF